MNIQTVEVMFDDIVDCVRSKKLNHNYTSWNTLNIPFSILEYKISTNGAHFSICFRERDRERKIVLYRRRHDDCLHYDSFKDRVKTKDRMLLNQKTIESMIEFLTAIKCDLEKVNPGYW